MLSASANASTARSTSAPAFPVATYCAALLVLVWLVAMAQLLWHFETQRLAESQQLMRFDTRDLPAPPSGAPAGSAKAIYFIDGQCRCAAAALAEIRRLQSAMTLPLAQFISKPINGARGAAAQALGIDAQPLTTAEQAGWRNLVPATAAVALWDTHDRLIYFGPVNVGGFCTGGSANSKSYLETALQSLGRPTQQSMDVAFKTWDVVACACPASAQS
jgi:hypothetical protein